MTGASAASNGRPLLGRGLGRGPRFLWAAAVGLEYAGAARMVPLLGLGSTASDRSCAARSVEVRRREAMTPLGLPRRSSMRNAAEHPLASLPRDEWKGGSIGSYALRAFDDTRDLNSSSRRRNPALNFMAPRGTRRRQELESNLTPC